MKMELSQIFFNAGHWRTLQAICACSQICNWSTTTRCLEIPRNCSYKHYQISSGARASHFKKNNFNTKSDQNIHQDASNCTFLKKFSQV